MVGGNNRPGPDKRSSDISAKLIAVGQTTWFVVQLCARWVTNLPVTEMEAMTLAFAAMNVPIYIFWWNKPQGVGVPIRIQRDAQAVKKDTDDQPLVSTDEHAQSLTWTGIREAVFSFFQRVIQKFKDIFEIDSDSFKPKHFRGRFSSSTPGAAVMRAIFAESSDIADGPREKVESSERTGDLEPKNAADKLVAYRAVMIFGAIHCIAWTSQFPSEQEKILWQVCSLLVPCCLYPHLY
ncbi:hypothetical protein D9757_012390 [Collybiopsis confluens]|uniref:Uncharacterized protein n=1 Tax=Collybiopsis confluens TaxID=2823264 RepID=A0A8H5LQV5_9AGAR|nr:hypothetical protein D9757_012390 [Collybiopsis confluens]